MAGLRNLLKCFLGLIDFFHKNGTFDFGKRVSSVNNILTFCHSSHKYQLGEAGLAV